MAAIIAAAAEAGEDRRTIRIREATAVMAEAGEAEAEETEVMAEAPAIPTAKNPLFPL